MGHLTRLLLLGVLLLGCASQALAGFSLVPRLTLREEYNDNIDLVEENEEDDFITTVTPALLMKWDGPRVEMKLDAQILLQKYANNSDDDRIGPGESDQATTFDALVKIVPDLFFLKVTDRYQRVPLDEGDRGGEGNNSVNLTDSNQLTINPYLQFDLKSDLQLKLGYTYENRWYGNEDDGYEDDDEGDDATSHKYSLDLIKALSGRTSLSLSGSHLEYRPKDALDVYLPDEGGEYDFDQDNVRLGLSYQISEQLQIKGGYGHSWLDYELGPDFDTEAWDVSADYALSSTLKTGIAYTLNYSVSVEDGASERDDLTAYIGYDDERLQVRLSVFMTNEDYVELDRKNDSYGGDVSGTLPFNDRFGLTWGLRYANYDESSSELRLVRINVPLPPNSVIPGDSFTVIVPRVIDTSEEYDRYDTRLALYYDISMGRLSAGYIYTLNESDRNENDYTNNILYLQASLTF